MAEWSFLTNHARVLLCIAHDPGARLRDISASLGITERTAHGIITDLAEAGYVVKQKDGRRNRYRIEADLPLREIGSREPAIGEVLAVLLGNTDGLAGFAGLAAAGPAGGGPGDGSDVVTLRAGVPVASAAGRVTTRPARLRPRAVFIPASMVAAVLPARRDGVDTDSAGLLIPGGLRRSRLRLRLAADPALPQSQRCCCPARRQSGAVSGPPAGRCMLPRLPLASRSLARPGGGGRPRAAKRAAISPMVGSRVPGRAPAGGPGPGSGCDGRLSASPRSPPRRDR